MKIMSLKKVSSFFYVISKEGLNEGQSCLHDLDGGPKAGDVWSLWGTTVIPYCTVAHTTVVRAYVSQQNSP